MPDAVELDLVSAQLGIVAVRWNVPSLQAFLQTRQSVWAELANAARAPLDETAKPVLKDAIYSLVFGMHERSNEAGLTRNLGKGASHGIFGLATVKDLLAARAEDERHPQRGQHHHLLREPRRARQCPREASVAEPHCP